MKTNTYLSLIFIAIVSALFSCKKQDAMFNISDNPNPWEDDYRDVSSMADYGKWGTYNVHDPSCKLFGDTYYMYSTDAIFREDSAAILKGKLPFGYVQIRKSKDLVNWEFVGWAFDKIPDEAKQWVLSNSGGKGASNIWAPYILKYKEIYRLYYCVSAFGLQTSYIGLAESDSPEGPWVIKGSVVKTKRGDVMNAIDPSIAEDSISGKQWMHYGSYFGGLHCVELNPQTGLTLIDGDQGHLTARRYDGKRNNIEAPEIIYNPQFKKWYLFISYDPLVTSYNIRVGRSDTPEGPFLDFNGKDMREEEDNFPILTYPYRFENHSGWSGVGHCAVFKNENGKYFMAHQGRLAPKNHMMDLHIREVLWTDKGWPVVSPQRYANILSQAINKHDMIGNWEVILIEDINNYDKVLVAGQVQSQDMHLDDKNKNVSKRVQLNKDMSVTGVLNGKWEFNSEAKLTLILDGKLISDILVFAGQDWENQTQTILFSGLTKEGKSFWGKKCR